MNRRRARLQAGVVALVVTAACGGSAPAPGTSADQAPAAAAPASADWFTDVAQSSGIDFTHVNGASGKYYYPEILPPGVALFDMDNDGDLDVYLVQGHPLPGPNTNPELRGRVYRNDLPAGGGALRFTDVTAQSGIDARGYGFGVAAGDVDNDGFTDLYLTSFGGNTLYRNNRNGTFTDVTKQSGTANQPGWDRGEWITLQGGGDTGVRVKHGRPRKLQ